MFHSKVATLGALALLIPGDDRLSRLPDLLPPRNCSQLSGEVESGGAINSNAERYYSALTAGMNPRLSIYEEPNPLIVVAEIDKGDDHKAQVIRVIESSFGSSNPPRVVYIDVNLLNEDAAVTFEHLLRQQGIDLGSVRAINFSMASWLDKTSPRSGTAMRRNLVGLSDTIFVHGAGNLAGLEPTFGLTTQSDHSLVVGATCQGRDERAPAEIREADFTASSTSASSAVDLVMRGQDLPIDGLSGRWSKDGRDDPSSQEVTGTSFAAPQITALAAKMAARLRQLHVKGLPGQRFSEELSQENLRAREQRQDSFVDLVTSSIMLSADAVYPGNREAVVTSADGRPFDTMGSGFGIPDFALAERIAFDQIIAAQLAGRNIPTLQYQSYAPENNQVFPCSIGKSSTVGSCASMRAALRNAGPVHVPVALHASPVVGEYATVAIDIPPFTSNLSAQLIRGSLLCQVIRDESVIMRCQLFIESADGSYRLPLGSFTPEPKESLFGDERHHPIDDYRLINFRTRGLMLAETAAVDSSRGMRLIIKTEYESDARRLKFFASGSELLPVLEVSGVPHDQNPFAHHPVDASRIGVMTQADMVERYRSDFEALEDAFDGERAAQSVIEDFIEAKPIKAYRVLEALPQLRTAAVNAAAGEQESLQRALGLLLHRTVVEPVGRAAAEKLMHLAYHYEQSRDERLAETTSAYTALYREVLEYERAFVDGRYAELPERAERIALAVNSQRKALAEYAKLPPLTPLRPTSEAKIATAF